MENIPFLFKENFFSEEVENLVKDELRFLNNPNLMKAPEITGTAYSKEGVCLKRNNGVFLKDVYADLVKSSIWLATREIFSGLTEEFSKLHMCNRTVLSTNYSTVLASYYEDSDYYLPHFDSSVVTVLYWFFDEPKRFTGGNLTFSDTGETVTVKNNSVLLFPSWAKHSVDTVSMEPEDRGKKLGRYCISQFLLILAE